ncbi:hypothetical protein NCLIV_021890 [Neospora caninum Liverpool]|uniref:Glutamate [NMDA] receptor-associated protein 1 n=1 Tax=Neospora caninum (strain Liverpool) TaxID=572307 RepID=F0VFA6_NEOCL|nr:hypothetical protein NCLIV_021890 [Neospora caninum Liverpool]CBZ52400.1 hypothetical protein NCLIV_021890 [Neospora caninum Liverpool]CEL66372.1 TPA: Glutamate [NMDA] receptor-associated protein 1 [Neospora caninum Liverpool]|eukprot:XP_003882432.1 hypothetical protein NCLIV_021890 [Neospora caninum Liverpool]
MATKEQQYQPQAAGQGYPAYQQNYYQQPPPAGYPAGGYGSSPPGQYTYPQAYQQNYGYYGQPAAQTPAAAPYGAGEGGAYPAPPPAAYAYQQHEAPATYGKMSSLPSTLPPGVPPGAVDIETGSQASDMITPDVDRAIRHAFVRKVYVILSIQVLFTFGLATAFTLVSPMRTWIQQNSWFPVALSFVGLVLMIVALTLFACQTKVDFTGCGPYILVAMICLMMFGIFCIFWYSRVANLIYASLASLLFSFLLVYDTQQVVGGKHRKFQYSIDDYIFAALSLYMDIIGLFMNILSLLSNS